METRTTAVAIRTWAVLTEASAVASVAVLPYVLSLQKETMAEANAKRVAAGKSPITAAKLAGLAAIQGHVTFGTVAALGLRAACGMGLGAPYLERRLSGEEAGLHPAEAATYAAAGVGAALAIGALDHTAFRGVLRTLRATGLRTPAPWRGLLASTYGAVGEEVLMRLGAQTLIAAGLRRLSGETAIPPTGATMWPAIALSNLLFGAGHLPAARLIMPLSPAFVARTLALNGVAGVVFGYLYWKRGLEAAMIAHGSADLVLHVGGSLIEVVDTSHLRNGP